MRSQLLIALEQFSGVVIFATNLVTNYDPAFESRLQSVAFTMPDAAARRAIWANMMVPELQQTDVDLDALAAVDDVCGRDIRNATFAAARRSHRQGKVGVTGDGLMTAILRLKAGRPTAPRALEPVELPAEEHAKLEERIAAAVAAE